jgi:hypothetical protein
VVYIKIISCKCQFYTYYNNNIIIIIYYRNYFGITIIMVSVNWQFQEM